MTCLLLTVYRLVVILSSLIVITNIIVFCIYQTITYNQKILTVSKLQTCET